MISLNEFVATLSSTAAVGGLLAFFVWPKRGVIECVIFSVMACFVGCCIGTLMSDWMIELGQIDASNRWAVLSMCCVPFFLWIMRILKERV